MTEKQQEVQRWLDYASQDFAAAKHLMSSMRPCPYEIVCFHCQQVLLRRRKPSNSGRGRKDLLNLSRNTAIM